MFGKFCVFALTKDGKKYFMRLKIKTNDIIEVQYFKVISLYIGSINSFCPMGMSKLDIIL